MFNSYENTIKAFSRIHALVIGDIMMDSYLKGQSNRICREAPVPIVNVDRVENVPGGAGNTALNLARLGSRVELLSVSGDDAEGDALCGIFHQHGIGTDGIVKIAGRETLAKKRVVSGSQLLVRYDSGSTGPIPPDAREKLTSYLLTAYGRSDVIIISDYEYGVLIPEIIGLISRLVKLTPKPVVVDTKTLSQYKHIGVAAVKPNYGEFVSALNLEKLKGKDRIAQVLEHGQRLIDIANSRIAAVTVDTDGAVVFEREKAPFSTGTIPAENTNAAGAGDTFVSALALALAVNAPTKTAAEIAAAAASIVVHKEGTAVCSQDALIARFVPQHKILNNIEELDLTCRMLKEQNKRIVFTNGFFDLLHTGHIEFLEEAKKRGDVLIIGVNSDESVRRLKGNRFLVNSAIDRMRILASLTMVDYVIGFSENTALRLIQAIRPEVFVKGGTYSRSDLVETQFVEELGGRVEILPYFVPGNMAGSPDLSQSNERRHLQLL